MNLALWLKRNGFRADQVQNFLPSPMATATAMYHTGRNPLKKLRRDGGETVFVPKTPAARRLPQGVPALPRSRELAAPAPGAAPDGARRSDRQRPAKADPAPPAGFVSRQAGARATGKSRPFRTQHVR